MIELCPHCGKSHINALEAKFCPMRPEQSARMGKQFGVLATGQLYGVTDRVCYWHSHAIHDQLETGVVVWIVSPNSSGTKVEPDALLRYIIEREDRNADFGFAPGFDAVYEADIVGRLRN